MQIHWPVTEPQKKGDRIDPSVKETWTALEKLVDEVMPLALKHAEHLYALHDLYAHRHLMSLIMSINLGIVSCIFIATQFVACSIF